MPDLKEARKRTKNEVETIYYQFENQQENIPDEDVTIVQ